MSSEQLGLLAEDIIEKPPEPFVPPKLTISPRPEPADDSVGSTRAEETVDKPKRGRIGRHAPRKAPRRFDTTALHYDQTGRAISHADYMAHCEKYDYAFRQIRRGDRILDVGCGTDRPLMYAITKSMTTATDILQHSGGYVGIDLNKIKPSGFAWATTIGEIDATDPINWSRIVPRSDKATTWAFGEYTYAICLEVIEHMDVPDGKRLLETIFAALKPGGRLVLSTPVYDGKGMARNHVHEYFIPELQELIESVGFRVDRRMGTFTSEPQLKRWLKENHPDWLEIYMAAREFHTPGYMAGVFAPLVPDLARNNVWDIVKPEETR